MSTRSIYNIKWNKNNLCFYRHWDGYLEEGGKELATLLVHYQKPSKFIKGMFFQSRGIYIHDMDRPLYELVNSPNMGEEFIYNITFNGDKLSIDVQAEKIEKKEGFNIDNQDYDVSWSSVYKKSGTFEEVANDFFKYCSDLSYKATQEELKKSA